MRDDFTRIVIKTVAARAGFRCSNPDCCTQTSGPHTDPTKAVNIGEAAHITAASPGGKRYDPNLTSAERSLINNAIWLCTQCARLIDKDEKKYTVELLQQWKETAEQAARDELEQVKPVNQFDRGEQYRIALKWARVGRRVSLAGFDLSGRELSEINLERVDLRMANLSRANLSSAKLQQADLRRANLAGAILSDANLIMTDLKGANLTKVILNRANLRGADLAKTTMIEADLRGCDLRGTFFNEADLTGAILHKADLSEADNWVTDLMESLSKYSPINLITLLNINTLAANLSGADLTRADLTEANLKGVYLGLTNLSGANLKEARFNEATWWPLDVDPIKEGAIED